MNGRLQGEPSVVEPPVLSPWFGRGAAAALGSVGVVALMLAVEHHVPFNQLWFGVLYVGVVSGLALAGALMMLWGAWQQRSMGLGLWALGWAAVVGAYHVAWLAQASH